ncbi:MAG TPA: ATP-binding protein [Methylophilaceae bacterium]|nr:ATP-binding protein [Methylophilaceae bacterium]
MAISQPQFIPFTVEAALLKELGERLVGKPDVALSELVKNGYDADAINVHIKFESDAIEIIDNGNGMTAKQFVDYWMSIGTTNKQRNPVSSRFKRQVTGSKGIGRLSAQFLGRQLTLWSISRSTFTKCLQADVDWTQAQVQTSLIHSGAWVKSVKCDGILPKGWRHGTRIRITGLNQEWGKENFVSLARQLWYLRPPLMGRNKLPLKEKFDVELQGGDETSVKEFNRQMTAALSGWIAEISGHLTNGRHPDSTCKISVRFKNGDIFDQEVKLPFSSLNSVEFQIKVFNLSGRQSTGIEVGTAREYFHKYGGVHIYDGSFRLPFYGGSQGDWLNLEIDHSHRLMVSKLLPQELQSEGDLRDLPTNSRIFGLVKVSTNDERIVIKDSRKAEYLNIQLTRDRLIENKAFADLKYIVRWAIDFYAMKISAKRQKENAENPKPVKPSEPIIQELQLRFSELRNENLSQSASTNIKVIQSKLNELEELEQHRKKISSNERMLLGALATAGMGSVALEHELGKEVTALRDMLENLPSSIKQDKDFAQVIRGFRNWIERSIQLRKLFSPLMNDYDREKLEEFNAKRMISMIIQNSTPLLRGVQIDISDVSPTLLLPLSAMSAWQAILQNAFVNAINALIESPTKKIVCQAGIRKSGHGYIRIEDTGVGLDLSQSEDLFKPFVRRLSISPERQALGLGGVGLGLTIVRMVANAIKCDVLFVEPSKGMSTALEISWNKAKNENPKVKNRHHR